MNTSFYLNKENVKPFKNLCKKMGVRIDMEKNEKEKETYISVDSDIKSVIKLNKIYDTFSKNKERKSFFNFLFK